MKGQFTRLIIFISVCVLLIVGITAVTYAFWVSGSGATPASTETDEWEDPSFRYLVLTLELSDGSEKEVSYVQRLGQNANFNAFYTEGTDPNTVTKVSVTGYNGILTVLKIPPEVTLKSDENAHGVKKTVTEINMKTVEIYDGLRVVEELEIPHTVTEIGDYSFAFCDSLKKVVFAEGENAQPLEIGKFCFYKCRNLSKDNVSFGGRSVTEGEFAFGR